ncbi:PHB depolymerase family esterase [Halomonas sp. YLGW01]|uniref:extracellular catalytic domain type 2 short-chain-length polyhydroxyalkanoate depolymerase n=1 Tax=Halomonas sp. YLGW01 TaxID=2773308 RepID=UPI001780E50D|nr:PHB depolymerase family esterase [Halomonas sp. YLGW01]
MKTVSLAAALALGLSGPALAANDSPSPLPVLTLDPAAISVMGISSGGYMATQLAVAHPERFQGLAVFAAGPWGCARGELSRALGQCMATRRGLPERDALEERLAAYREESLVGSAASLGEQRVYLWHGEADATVAPALGERLAAQYRGWLADPETQLKVVRQDEAGHGWPVDAGTLPEVTAEDALPPLADCREGGAPYLLDCGIDGAGEALSWLYEDLKTPDDTASGMLWTFDQTAFDDDMAEQGFLYVPKACEEGAPCGLVVVLHGCQMHAEAIGEAFVRRSGLNRWAAANRLVVLYPQATSSLANPQGCWDWWGYEESLWQPEPRHDSRAGEQLQGLMGMVHRLSGQAETDHSGTAQTDSAETER